jgi:hypothetical protein
MDAVYAWDQPDIHLYVPGGDHYPAAEAIRFQTSLMGDLNDGQWLAHEP